MRATVMYAAGDVRVENIPDASLREPTDALIRVTRACVCSSDLWPYNLKKPGGPAQRMGHEAIGIVEAVGPEVRTLKAGDTACLDLALGIAGPALGLVAGWGGLEAVFLASALVVLCAVVVAVRPLRAPSSI